MHSPSSLRPFLDRLASRSILSPEEEQSILDLPVRARQARPNQDFVTLGQKVDHACFVLEGLIGRFDQNARGDRQITALHIAGDMPDLHSVVQPTASSALQALTTSMVLEVPHSALRDAAARHPAIAEAFWRDTMVDSMILAQWVVNVGRRNALSRLAHLFCELACRYNVVPVDGKASFELHMTQLHLAEAAGLTPVHVNRTLKKLAEIGTTIHHKMVQIGNWDALVEVGDFHRAYLQENGPEQRMRIME
jgi:CRP-like cAMP-binding protein